MGQAAERNGNIRFFQPIAVFIEHQTAARSLHAAFFAIQAELVQIVDTARETGKKGIVGRAIRLVFQLQILLVQQVQQPPAFGRVVHIGGTADPHRTGSFVAADAE